MATGTEMLLTPALQVLPLHQKLSDWRWIATPSVASSPLEVPVDVEVSSTAVPLIAKTCAV